MQKVSVIVPTYNRAHCIADALDSIIKQTFKCFEIIIIDDGSTDNTKDVIVRYFKDLPFNSKYFFQKNAGPAAARNLGINKSTGDYIAFLDSDDIWIDTKIAEQIDFLNSHPNIALIFSDMKQTIGGKEHCESFLRYYDCYNVIFEKNKYLALSKKPFIFTPTVMIRKNIISTVGLFNNDYRVGEDWEYWLRITKKFEIGFIDKPLVVRRLHDSNTPQHSYYHGVVDLLKCFVSSNDYSKDQKRIFKKSLCEWQFWLGYFYFSKNEYQNSQVFFYESFVGGCRLKAFLYMCISFLPTYFVNLIKTIKRGSGANFLKKGLNS